MKKLTVAICTYNRADRLSKLIKALREQFCSIPFEILIVDNNSTDETQEVLSKFITVEEPQVRVIIEEKQGIVPARNRAIMESMGSQFLYFMDDDELPLPGLLEAVVHSLIVEGADCVGGRVRVVFNKHRPKWLTDDLLGFFAEVDYGNKSFWIKDHKHKIWTCNVGYKTALFKDGLLFDQRYNREGKNIGGGEDEIMFNRLFETGVKMRYRPDMVVEHFVEEWRVRRSYFIRLHYLSGKKRGLFDIHSFKKSIVGVPPFLLLQALQHLKQTISMLFCKEKNVMRQTMIFSNTIGIIVGFFLKWKYNIKDCVDLQGRPQSFVQEVRDEANSDILS